MSVAPVGVVVGAGGGIPPLSPHSAAPLPTGGGAGPAGFGDLVSQFLQEANSQQLQVGQQINSLATGETDNVQDVVMSVAKADLAFRLVMEIRNRLISSYQELMRMQV